MQPLSTFALQLTQNTKDYIDKKSIKTLNDLRRLINSKQEIQLSKRTCIQAAFSKINSYSQIKPITLKDRLKQNQTSNNNINQKNYNIFQKIIADASITEIYGQRGTCKTMIGLQLCEKYQKLNENRYVLILNASSGITWKRLCLCLKLSKCIYRDVQDYFSILNIIDELIKKYEKKNLKQEKQLVGLIFIDDLDKVLKLKQQPDQLVNNIMLKLAQIQNKFLISTIFSVGLVLNHIKFSNKQNFQETVYNNVSQFSGISGGFVDNRIMLHKINQKEWDSFLMVLMKNGFGEQQKFWNIKIIQNGRLKIQ